MLRGKVTGTHQSRTRYETTRVDESRVKSAPDHSPPTPHWQLSPPNFSIGTILLIERG